MKPDKELTIEYTGERVVPNSQDLNYVLHLAAYEFISPLVTVLDVLDVGWGTGYGADVLINAQARAIAIPLPWLLFAGALSARARSGARGESHE